MKKYLFLAVISATLVVLTSCTLPAFITSKISGGVPGEGVKTAAQTDVTAGVKNDGIIEGAASKEADTANKVKLQDGKSGNTRESSIAMQDNRVIPSRTFPDEYKGDKIPVTLYYQDREGYLIPVSRLLERQEGIARAAIGMLTDSTINREDIEYYGLYPALPAGTELLGINIREGTATIDFGRKFTDYRDETSEKNIIASVVYTLTGFNTVNNVKILVNGYPQKVLKYGTDISGVLTRSNVLLNSKKANLTPGTKKVDVFLYKRVNSSRNYLLPVSVEQNTLSEEELPGKIVDLLAKDYSGTKLFSQIPAKTRLLQSSIKGNTLELNFNSEFVNYGGTSREEGVVKQVLYSMRQIKGVDKVRIKVEGKDKPLPEGTEISGEHGLPKFINAVIESF